MYGASFDVHRELSVIVVSAAMPDDRFRTLCGSSAQSS
jgi:hypothetical protein